MATFGERLKELRKEKNLTQEQLAEIFKVTQVTISKYERNFTETDITTLFKFADFFDVTTDYLLGKSDLKHGNKSDKQNLHFFEKDNLTKEDMDYLNMMIETMKKRNNEKE